MPVSIKPLFDITQFFIENFFKFTKFISFKIYISVISFGDELGKSFKKIKNSKGPRTESCATPHVMLSRFELKPLTKTHCFFISKIGSKPVKSWAT